MDRWTGYPASNWVTLRSGRIYRQFIEPVTSFLWGTVTEEPSALEIDDQQSRVERENDNIRVNPPTLNLSGETLVKNLQDESFPYSAEFPSLVEPSGRLWPLESSPLSTDAAVQHRDDQPLFSPVTTSPRPQRTVNMGDANALLPTPFSGKSSEDINDFLRHFELWSEFKGIDRTVKLSALPLMLKDGASAWYYTQSQQVRGNWHALLEALRERYGPDKSNMWRATSDLWKLRQEKSQSTEDFITQVQKAGQRIDASDQQIYLVVLNGLRSEIRMQVIQHQTCTLDDLRKWGKITELSLQDASDHSQNLEKAIQDLASIKDDFQRMTVNAVTKSSVVFPPAPSGPPPSSHSFPSCPRFYPQAPENSQVSFRTPPAATNPQAAQNFRPSRRGTFNQKNFSPRSIPSPVLQPSGCWRCGNSHPRNTHCRAINLTCHYCGRVGHVQSVCRVARSHQTPPAQA